MDEIFIKIFNMSLVSLWLILAVIILRLFLKKSPKWIRCVLWAMVAVRLIVPFSFESGFSLVPNAQALNESSYSSTSYISSDIGDVMENLSADSVEQTENTFPDILAIASFVWAAGAVIMFLYMLLSYVILARRLRERIKLRDNIWICDRIKSPFVFGIFKPQIYLLSSMSEEERKYVIAHENTHLKRLDHIWKPLGFLLLCIHWFNPFCWLAYWLFNKDIELACDESVIRELDAKGKKGYSTALLMCSSVRHSASACPLAFGENNIKQRIKCILDYKKPAVRVIVITFAACIAVAVSFMTDPLSAKSASNILKALDSEGSVMPVKLNDTVISDLELNKVYSLISEALESDNLDSGYRENIEKIELDETNKEILIYIKNLDESEQEWFENNICDTPYVVYVNVEEKAKEKPTEPALQEETRPVTDEVITDTQDNSYDDYSDYDYSDDSYDDYSDYDYSDNSYDDYSDYSDDSGYSGNSDNSSGLNFVPITPYEPDYDYYFEKYKINDGYGSSKELSLTVGDTQTNKYTSVDDIWPETQWDINPKNAWDY